MESERRFVVDANVLVSGLLFRQSPPRKALDLSLELGIILVSDNVFLELETVLFRPKFDRYLDLKGRQLFLENLLETALFVEINERVDECRDPKDNKYLELAVSGQAESIITGDRDLLVLSPFRGIHILTVQEFLANHQEGRD